jgi:transposase
LNRWKSQLAFEGKSAFPGKGRLTPEKEELQKLRKENQRLKRELCRTMPTQDKMEVIK